MREGSEPSALVYSGGELPDLGALLNETVTEFMENIGPYALAGLGQMLVVIPIALVMIFGMYAMIALGIGGMLAGGAGLAAVLPGELAGLGALAGALVGLAVIAVCFFGFIGLMGAMMAPINASLLRAIAAHQRGEKTLELSSAFSSLGENIGAVIGGAAILTLLSVALSMMCYFPALLPVIFLGFAAPLIALHGRGAVEGIQAAAAHARSHLKWHALYGLLHFALLMAASSIPVVGVMFVLAFQVRAYRRVFGDGRQPVLA